MMGKQEKSFEGKRPSERGPLLINEHYTYEHYTEPDRVQKRDHQKRATKISIEGKGLEKQLTKVFI